MKKYFIILPLGICTVLLLCLFGCTNPNVSPESTSGPKESEAPKQDFSNMVDERFELLSLVFRFAGRKEYGDLDTQYQQTLVTEFEQFKEHDAVKYAQRLPLGYDAVFNFSVHIEKQGEQFVLIDDIESLIADGRWTKDRAVEFLELLNNFYTETGFAAFYRSNVEFYNEQTQLFNENMYGEIDLAWFDTYVDSDNLRCIYTPSTSLSNYGATVNGTIVYCGVSGNGGAIVHEYCHSFANPIAHKWYGENPEFKAWCEDTVDLEKLPSYGNGQTIAGEYVTRAYTILYYVEHGYAVTPLLYGEKGRGFPYIEEVYGMITPYEKLKVGEDPIKTILGVGYEMGEERSFSAENNEFHWRVLSLEKASPYLFRQTEVGNIFGSSTGDVLYVEDAVEDAPFLMIDLGETTYQGIDNCRIYTRIPLE